MNGQSIRQIQKNSSHLFHSREARPKPPPLEGRVPQVPIFIGRPNSETRETRPSKSFENGSRFMPIHACAPFPTAGFLPTKRNRLPAIFFYPEFSPRTAADTGRWRQSKITLPLTDPITSSVTVSAHNSLQARLHNGLRKPPRRRAPRF